MKKLLSILLAVLLLGGVMSVGLSAAAAPAVKASNSLMDLILFFTGSGSGQLTDAQLKTLIELLEALKRAGINYEAILKTYNDKLPIAAKAALHKAGLMKYPIYERNLFFNIIFKYLLFGWIWM